jgi:uncharacterized protein (DUF433 family)
VELHTDAKVFANPTGHHFLDDLNETLLPQANEGMFTGMKNADRITFNPEQCGGRPCIRGMRIRVKDVLDLLASGVSEREILEDYPDLQADDIRACLEYAAEQIDHPVFHVAAK